MDFVKNKVKFVEPFKDGNIMEGRLFKADEIEYLTDEELHRVEQSGAVVYVLDRVIPNPLKAEKKTAHEEAKEKHEKETADKTGEAVKSGKYGKNK